MGRLDLLLPPPINTSDVFYRPTGTIPRFERPVSVEAQVLTLSRASKIPAKTLFAAYQATLADKRDVPMDISPKNLLGNTPSVYTPPVTNQIVQNLMAAQLPKPTQNLAALARQISAAAKASSVETPSEPSSEGYTTGPEAASVATHFAPAPSGYAFRDPLITTPRN